MINLCSPSHVMYSANNIIMTGSGKGASIRTNDQFVTKYLT